MKHYMVSAMLRGAPEQKVHRRARHEWTDEPREITVLDHEPAKDEPREDYVLSPSELEQLLKDPLVKVATRAGHALTDAAKETAIEKAEAEKARAESDASTGKRK
jgi:predicted amidohydrolase YtcJ